MKNLQEKAIATYQKVLEHNPDHKETHRDLGIAYAEKSDYEKALVCLNKALELGLKDAEVYYYSGISYKNLGLINKALSSFKNALAFRTSTGQSVRVYAELGRLYFENGNLDEALFTLQKANQLNPNDLDTCINLALACDEKGLLEEAASWYMKAILLKPDHSVAAELSANLGLVYLVLGMNDEAYSTCKQAVVYAESTGTAVSKDEHPDMPEKQISPHAALAYAVIGAICLVRGAYHEAVSAYEKRLQLISDDILSMHHLGIAYQRNAQTRQLLSVCEQKIAQIPDNPNHLLTMAKIYLSLDNYDDAVKILERLIKSAPENYQAYYYLSSAFEHKGELEKALNQYQYFLNSKPKLGMQDYLKSAQLYLQKGSDLEVAKEFKKAIEANIDGVKITPHNIESYPILGNAYMELGLPEEAIAIYKKTLLFNPNDSRSYFALGAAYLAKGLYSESMEAYTRAYRISSVSKQTSIALAQVYLSQGNYEEAISVCLKRLNIAPQDIQAYFILGKAYKNQSAYDKAIKVYEKIIELNPDNAEAYGDLGSIYSMQNLLEEAVAHLKKAVALNPQDAKSFYILGKAYKQKGLTKESSNCFQKASDLNPQYNQKVDAQGDFEEEVHQTITKYKKEIEINPNDKEVCRKLGVIYNQNGLYDEAIYYYKKLVKLDPNDMDAYLNLGAIYTAKGENGTAMDYYEDVTKRQAGNPDLYLAVAETYFQQQDYSKVIGYCIPLADKEYKMPFSVKVHKYLAESYRHLAKYHEAVKSYEWLINAKAVDASVYEGLAECYKTAYTVQETVSYINKLFEKTPMDSRLHNWLAGIYYEQGKYDEAIDSYQRVISLEPENAEAHARLSMIYLLKSEK
ncbi:MAG: tetratricopeptide repeat protein [Planctomycetes bacterium]|nr:tetratricopeptide repeat protein [Planctomycetota bacterium]